MKEFIVLLIGESVQLRNVLAPRLKVRGIRVDMAVNGFQGMHLAEKFAYGLVLIDEELKDMSGIEVASLMRQEKEKNELPIFIFSVEEETKEALPSMDKISALAEAGINNSFTSADDVNKILEQISLIEKEKSKA